MLLNFMPKYQFYTFPFNQRDQFTYLDLESITFASDEAQLLLQRFKPDGAPIVANNAQSAVHIYQNRVSAVVEDYQRSFVSYVMIHGIASWINKLKNRNS